MRESGNLGTPPSVETLDLVKVTMPVTTRDKKTLYGSARFLSTCWTGRVSLLRTQVSQKHALSLEEISHMSIHFELVLPTENSVAITPINFPRVKM